MKIVISIGGSFEISCREPKLIKEYFKLKGYDIYAYTYDSIVKYKLLENPEYYYEVYDYFVKDLGREFRQDDYNKELYKFSIYSIGLVLDRTDQDLLNLVEEGLDPDLKIVEIPDDVEWEINSDDFREWIAEKHRVWY